jgi:DNA polymerase-3 subunit gamma/tau
MTTLARVLAMALNCENKQGRRRAVRRLRLVLSASGAEARASIVVEIDAASQPRRVTMRVELRASARCTLRPATIATRCTSLDEAHMLTAKRGIASSRFSRSRPPGRIRVRHHEPQKRLRRSAAPVLSRLATVRPQAHRHIRTLSRGLQLVQREEKIDGDPRALAMIAPCSDGSMRDALSLTDQVVSLGERQCLRRPVRAVALGPRRRGRLSASIDMFAGRRAGEAFDVWAPVWLMRDVGFRVFLRGLATCSLRAARPIARRPH